ncbi:hypothetical protein [Streptomyces sp. TRM49041]|uniref:hypothetical protein n=1 Tax=Streptomyces sp. TRM49041 TaxID=2603216 RepID=UPI0011F04B86|nr:hypothetical protein [Streptomyces sp. TRM49041]
MADTSTHIGGRRITAVLAMGGGLMLGPSFTAHTDSADGLGLSARTTAADHLAEPVAAAADTTAASPPSPRPTAGTTGTATA